MGDRLLLIDFRLLQYEINWLTNKIIIFKLHLHI